MQIKKMILKLLSESDVAYEINGDQKFCIPSTLNLSFAGVSSEALMLSAKQYCGVSNGSACNSNSYAPSYVLVAMGIPTEQVENSIRISWGARMEYEDIKRAFKELLAVAKKLS